MDGIIWKDGTMTYKKNNEIKTEKISDMNFYIYCRKKKCYFNGFLWGVPSFTPSKKMANTFDCPIEAGNFAWKWATCGDLVVTD
jgi:hypothetical protein